MKDPPDLVPERSVAAGRVTAFVRELFYRRKGDGIEQSEIRLTGAAVDQKMELTCWTVCRGHFEIPERFQQNHGIVAKMDDSDERRQTRVRWSPAPKFFLSEEPQLSTRALKRKYFLQVWAGGHDTGLDTGFQEGGKSLTFRR